MKVQNSIAAGEVDLREKQAENAAQTQANLNAINAATARARDSMEAFTSRIANLDKYVVKFEGTVYFGSGSFELTDEGKRAVDALVQQGQGLQGFMPAPRCAGGSERCAAPATSSIRSWSNGS